MNSEEPPPEESPRPPSPAGMEGLDPAELLARALNTVQPSDGQTAWIPPTPEELARLLPQYCIESLLGHGGMGAVYKGSQPALDRPVAIKLLPAEIAADEQFIARFRREARTLAKLQHSGIVSVYDFGQTSEGHLYFVMEFVEGTDLQKILRGPGLEPAQALNLISQVCDALHYAHSKGVIHRDIKPGNILVSTDGYVKLADFGLARPIKEDSTILTGGSVMMGTLDYMAPEQRDGHADQRADIYALGVMLYEMLTGKRPHGVFAPPSHRVQVDIRLDGVVLKALQQEPERRYQHVSEMKTDVDEIRTTPPPGSDAETEPQPVRPAARPRRPMAVPIPARPRAVSPGHPSPATILKTTHSSNHTILILGIVALLTIGGLALFLADRKNGDTYNTVQNLTFQEIQNNYFTNLITTGAATAKDLEAITAIRPFGSLFIGVSKEPLTLPQAQELAQRTGAALLQMEDSKSGTSQELTDWLRTTYASQLAATAWVRQTGEPRIFNSQSVLPQPNDGQPRKVFLQWQGPDSLLSLARKDGKRPQPNSGKTEPPTGTIKFEFDLLMDAKATIAIGANQYSLADLKQPITLPAGRQTLVVIQTGLSLPPQEFQVERGTRQIVRVFDPDRRAAEWVFATGGWVRIVGSDRQIASAKELPLTSFKLSQLELMTRDTARIQDESLAILAPLSELLWLGISHQDISDEALIHLGKLAKLQTLGLFDCHRITGTGFTSLGQLKDLRDLCFDGTHVGDIGLEHLRQAGIQSIKLRGCPITDAGLKHAAHLPNLTYLDVGGCKEITDDALREIGQSEVLTYFTVNDCKITDAGLILLSKLKKLQHLDVGNCAISNAGIKSIARLISLRDLQLPGTRITDLALTSLGQMNELSSLNLNDTAVTDKGIVELGRSKILRSLELDRTNCTDAALLAIGDLSEMTHLSMRSTKVSDNGLAPLNRLRRLEYLNLADTSVTDAGLLKLKGLGMLRTLELQETRVTTAGAAQLKAALPDCNILK